MKTQKFTIRGTEEKNLRFFKYSVNSVVASSQNVERLKDGIKKQIL